MWQEPKTDWTVNDYFNYTDYNRIKNNIAYLREQALKLYINFPFTEMSSDKEGYSDFPYAEEFNAMEDNLESLKNNTYAFYDGEHKNWYANNRTPTFEDFNRLESACLKLYNGFSRQEAMKHRLSFRLGQMSCIRI